MFCTLLTLFCIKFLVYILKEPEKNLQESVDIKLDFAPQYLDKVVDRHQLDCGLKICILMKQKMMGWQWHQLGHVQNICTLLQTDNDASNSSLILYMPGDPLEPQTTVKSIETRRCSQQLKLECGPMPNVMTALPNIGGALCSTPQSLADAHY